jgi:lipoprotein-anchoring transpeptidase ErfK/SrfK
MRPVRNVPKPAGIRRRVSALAVVLLAAGSGCALAVPARASASSVPASQPLVVLLHDHAVRVSPNVRARRIETVGARRPLTGVRTVLPVLGHAKGSGRTPWVRVRLPGRPNGHNGWISTSQTQLTSTEWHITVKLSARQVTAYRDGRVERRFGAVVGNPSTPTPRGQFFIEEALDISSQVGGPYALATSARSNVLQEFEGGPGQIALHGISGLGDPIGTAASHGCIRLSTSAITWLAERIGSGVPLTITQ